MISFTIFLDSQKAYSWDDLVLNFANNTVVPTLAGQDYTFVKTMDTSDTSKNFNGCTNTTTITGCQIPFQMTATDFAGNKSTHNQDDTTGGLDDTSFGITIEPRSYKVYLNLVED